MNILWGLHRRSFVRNAGMMIGSGLAAQALSILLQPIISRLYAPADYGVLSQFGAVAALLLAIGAFCYDLAIPRAGDDRSAAGLLALALAILFAASLALTMGFAIFHPLVRRVPVLDTLSPYHWFLPVALLGGGAYQAFSHLATRFKAFRQVSLSRLWVAITSSASQIALGLAGVGAVGLILGSTVAVFAGAVALFALVRADRIFQTSDVRAANVIAAARAHSHFASWGTANALVNSLGLNIHFVLMSRFYGLAPAGHLLMAMKTVYASDLIGLPIAQVFYGELTARHRGQRPLRALILKTTGWLTLIGAGIGLLLMIFARPLFRLWLGAPWDEAGQYAAALSFYVLSHLVGSPMSMVLVTVGRMRTAAVWSLGRLAIVIAGFAACHAAGANALTAVTVFSVTAGLSQWAMVALCLAAVDHERHTADSTPPTPGTASAPAPNPEP